MKIIKCFIGSSTEQIEIARKIQHMLSELSDDNTQYQSTLWKHFFDPGVNYLENLINKSPEYDYGIFVITPDDITESRNETYESTRDNVIFEMGIFAGSTSSKKIFAFYDENRPPKIMSDFDGISKIAYNGKIESLSDALSPACLRLHEAIKYDNYSLAKLQDEIIPVNQMIQEIIGLDTIYPTYTSAEPDILAELDSTNGPIRIFAQIGASTIGEKGSFFDKILQLGKKKVEIRTLHADRTSPFFNESRLRELGKNPDQIYRILDYVKRSLIELEHNPYSSLRHRTHKWPYVWRMISSDNKLFLMPYFADKNATKYSPVLLFSKKENSLYNTFVNLFDFIWEDNAPKEKKLSDFITPATPAAVALFMNKKLNNQEYHVFGIPSRDIESGSLHLRFYGIGGKRRDGEVFNSWDELALNKGNLEIMNAIDSLESSNTTYVLYSNSTIEEVNIFAEAIQPRLILEKRQHSGMGSMKKTDDHQYIIGYNARLKDVELYPSGNISCIVLLTDNHLRRIKRDLQTTIFDLENEGAIFIEKEGINIDKTKYLAPWGIATYLLRELKD